MRKCIFASSTVIGSTAGAAVRTRPMMAPFRIAADCGRRPMEPRPLGSRWCDGRANRSREGPAATLARDCLLVCGLSAEFQQLDRGKILHAAADTLGRVEQHVRLGAVGIAQHANADAIDD